MAEEDYADEAPYGDAIADRVAAYTTLVETTMTVKDRKLREECMLMLRATRMSFKTVPQAQVTAVGMVKAQSNPA